MWKKETGRICHAEDNKFSAKGLIELDNNLMLLFCVICLTDDAQWTVRIGAVQL